MAVFVARARNFIKKIFIIFLTPSALIHTFFAREIKGIVLRKYIAIKVY